MNFSGGVDHAMKRVYIAIFFIYRDFFLGHIAIQTNMGYMEIDGRLDGERRKYTISHSADATIIVLSHTHTFEFRCGATYIYTVNYICPHRKICRPCKYLNV